MTGSVRPVRRRRVLLMANPNLLYLQSTPMTEPLLIGTSLLAALHADWVDRRRGARTRRAAGWVRSSPPA